MTGCNFKPHAWVLLRVFSLCLVGVWSLHTNTWALSSLFCPIINMFISCPFLSLSLGQKEQKARLETEVIWRRGREQQRRQEEQWRVRMYRKKMKAAPRRRRLWIPRRNFQRLLSTRTKVVLDEFNVSTVCVEIMLSSTVVVTSSHRLEKYVLCSLRLLKRPSVT